METIGPRAGNSTNGSDLQTFVNFLSDPNTSIPLESNFLVAFDALPGVLGGSTGVIPKFPIGYENEWNIDDTRDALINAVKSSQHTSLGGQVCLFTQGFSVPGESVSAERISSALAGPSGGLLTGVVSKERGQYQQMTLGILETNGSFLDFVIRPWIALVGHYGLIARTKNSEQNVKADITGILYDKNNNNAVRKIFKFKGCAPVQIGETDYTYGKNEIRIEKVTFAFNTFSISSVAGVGGNASAISKLGAVSKASTLVKSTLNGLKAPLDSLKSKVSNNPLLNTIKKPVF